MIMSGSKLPINIFISRKKADAHMAYPIYDYLTALGLSVFESDKSLPKLGNSDYRKAIDEALDECRHMIVVGSSAENISSSWVEAEWGLYISEKRAGRKNGNILTVVSAGVAIETLPASLRYYEVIVYDQERLDTIAAYVSGATEVKSIVRPGRPLRKLKWALLSALFLVLAFFAVKYFQTDRKPFTASVFLDPDPHLERNPHYPPFTGGQLSLRIGEREDRKTVFAGNEVVFSQLPYDFREAVVPVTLKSDFWKLVSDSVRIGETMRLNIVPNDSLSMVFGRVINEGLEGVGNCKIVLDNDTSFYSDSDGYFKVHLPYRMLKLQYQLVLIKPGFHQKEAPYLPGSGYIELKLEK